MDKLQFHIKVDFLYTYIYASQCTAKAACRKRRARSQVSPTSHGVIAAAAAAAA